jgi:hybrid cluster-associated redox disulfide protein
MGKKASKKASGTAKPKVTGRTTIGKALELHPKAAAVFKKHGMSCTTCGGAHAEPIGKAAEMYGADPGKIVRELNELLGGE